MAKMSISKEKLERKLTPGGIYDVHLSGFKPSKGKSNPDNINLNPIVKIIGHPDFTGKPVFLSLPMSEGWMQQDFVHSFGLEMEQGTNGDVNMPGDWDFPTQDPATWKYRGPLLGKTAKWELIETEYQGKPQLKVKMMICSVPDCKTKNPTVVHSTNMVKG